MGNSCHWKTLIISPSTLIPLPSNKILVDCFIIAEKRRRVVDQSWVERQSVLTYVAAQATQETRKQLIRMFHEGHCLLLMKRNWTRQLLFS